MSAQSVLFDALGPRGKRTATIINIVGAALLVLSVVFLLIKLKDAGQLAGNLWSSALSANAWTNYYLPGLQNTLISALYAVVLALLFGLLFGVGRLSSNRAIRWFCGLVVEFFRAVPVLIMMVAAAAIGYLIGLDRTIVPLVAVVVALTLYNGSVIAELVRSGVHGLPKGQREAGLAVGMTRAQSIRSIELPQALIAMLPSLVSQFVVILKDSALGQLILYSELLRSARLLGSGAPFPILQTLFVAALIFIALNFLLGWIAQKLAKRLGSRTSGRTNARAPGGGAIQIGAASAAPGGVPGDDTP
ncbi:amino acid ABC transporter permease [Pseudactinotalea terrae]|uniref:amino acid ABC transporter permease n=1 Tax=Pseudactinotalea terrae TaxID=1743262 RepID=UPI0012E17E0C|nr:ABC transporter permease subunit [Pseudactinotalea terrae]